MASKKRKTSDLVEILKDRYVSTPEEKRLYEEVKTDFAVAQALYDLRKEAGLTQRELAARIGTQHTVISRIEDADYEGHSLSLLRRVASALGKRVEIRFVDDPELDVG